MQQTLPVGTVVGAGRWPFLGSHPDAWGRPWSGVVIALDDPRVWARTLAFPCDDAPDPEAVRAHVARCRLRGWLSDRVAVLWDFGSSGFRAYFESAASVRPYADDLAAWESALVEERATSAGFRLVKIGGVA